MSQSDTLIRAKDAQKPLYVGIDVGGTNIKIGLVDDAGQTLAYNSMPTEQDKGAEDACGRIARVVSQLIDRSGIDRGDVARTGIATPGPMDIAAGKILRPGNLPGWWDFPIRERLQIRVGIPVTFANDANAAAYGEFWRGAGAQHESMVLLTLGTGIGGGIIIGDTLVEGAHSCGGECGHILVNPAKDAWQDSLGGSGSLEAYANAGAVIRRATDALGASETSSLARRHRTGEPITPRMVAEEAERGDALAHNVVMETAHWLAIGIVTFVHTIDPDAVVLGGAMNFGGPSSPLGRDFLQRIRDEVRPRLLEPLRDTVKIEFASLGGDAGYIGAAGLARLEQRKQRERSGVAPGA
ncbi:MAG: ROK family protein [Pirellulales bacterium]